jgi:hypothetical protein
VKPDQRFSKKLVKKFPAIPRRGRLNIDGEKVVDQEKLKLLAHLKVSSRKAGFDLDLSKLVADNTYAIERLDYFAATENEDLVLTALMVKDKLGLMPIAALSESAPPREEPVETATKKDPEKYKFGPRG